MLGEELQCIHEMENVHDLYTVGAVKMETGTAGHLPKKISMPCHLSLADGRYSVDLLHFEKIFKN